MYCVGERGRGDTNQWVKGGEGEGWVGMKSMEESRRRGGGMGMKSMW
jgi:hypothetical protein